MSPKASWETTELLVSWRSAELPVMGFWITRQIWGCHHHHGYKPMIPSWATSEGSWFFPLQMQTPWAREMQWASQAHIVEWELSQHRSGKAHASFLSFRAVNLLCIYFLLFTLQVLCTGTVQSVFTTHSPAPESGPGLERDAWQTFVDRFHECKLHENRNDSHLLMGSPGFQVLQNFLTAWKYLALGIIPTQCQNLSSFR